MYLFSRWFVPDLILVPHSECSCGAGARRCEGSEFCRKASGPRLFAHSTDELPGVSGYWWIHKGCGKHVANMSKCPWATSFPQKMQPIYLFTPLVNLRYLSLKVKMAEEQPDFVIGFICGSKITKRPEFIHMTPGVQMQPGGDFKCFFLSLFFFFFFCFCFFTEI